MSPRFRTRRSFVLASLVSALVGACTPVASTPTETTTSGGFGAGGDTPSGVGGGVASAGGGGVGGSTFSAGSSNTGGAGGGLQISTSSGGSGGGAVPQTCAEALASKSYLGCEYWPTITSNSTLYDRFEYALALANPTESPASVQVSFGGQTLKQVSVAAHDLQIVRLPWVDDLKGVDPTHFGTDLTSALVRRGAYHVQSSVPLTVYQFNPLEFELSNPPSDCPALAEKGGCFSFSNDASLLLPTTALGLEYYAMSYQELHAGIQNGAMWQNLPSFVTVTATEDGTSVQVDSSAKVRGGMGVSALQEGGRATYLLDAGDVLQLVTSEAPEVYDSTCVIPEADRGTMVCKLPAAYDMTGTHIVATKPVSVLSGHDCAFVPYDRFACDHLEESMFPVEALGQDLVVTAPRSANSMVSGTQQTEMMFVRVLSAAADNALTFDPPVHAPVTLGSGQWIEIGPVDQDFRIRGSNKTLVSQYLVAGRYHGTAPGAAASLGDPSLSVAIPTEQYRLAYSVYAPSTYTYNLVNVVAPQGATVSVDEVPIPAGAFQPIGSSGMSVARHPIAGGAHRLSGSANFGVVVYGYAKNTSYMYPGGLNLEKITVEPR